MEWTGWNDGKGLASGGGFGLRVGIENRDRHFKQKWTHGEVELPGPEGIERVLVNVAKPSFWKRCPELIDARIGRWLLVQGLAPWPRRHPPRVRVEVVGEARFKVVL